MHVPGATVPERLGRYQLTSHLASGGMAEIFVASAPGARDPVVIKVISRERATDEKFVQMFLDEARLVATLNHPNIARLLEVGKDGQVYFLAMELVRGETVRAILERSARARQHIPHPVVLGVASAVARALHHAHERKGHDGKPLDIVHRDVTPSNVMVGRDGVVKLLDFGVARAKGRSQETVSGTVKGKFAYMAPEQCLGKRVDRRADVFSLGILLYEMSTLRRAFRAESDFETLNKIVKGEIAPPSSLVKDYPPALEALIQRAMSIDLDERFQTAAEVGVAIDAIADELGGVAGPPALRAFMLERFGAVEGEPADAAVEPVAPSPSRPQSVSQPPPGVTFSPALVPAPPREQRTTGDQPAVPAPAPTPTSLPAQPTPLPAPSPVAARAASALAGHSDWAGSERPGERDDAAQQKTMLGHGAPRAGSASAPPPPAPNPAVVRSMPAPAQPVALPPPPEPDRGLPWALPVALVAIALVTVAVVAAILFT